MSVQSTAKLGPALPALDLLHLGPSPLVRGFVRMGFMLSVFGDIRFPNGFANENLSILSRVRFGFSLFVSDWTTSGSSLSARSFVCCGLAVLVLDFLHLGFLPLMRSSVRSELNLPIFGLA